LQKEVRHQIDEILYLSPIRVIYIEVDVAALDTAAQPKGP